MIGTVRLKWLLLVVLLALPLPLLGNSRIVIISQGPDCVYCTQQFHLLTEFEPILTRFGVDVVFGYIASEEQNSNWEEQRGRFTLVSDSVGLKRLTDLVGAPAHLQHGSFIINSLGLVTWSDLGPGPFLDVSALAGKALQDDVGVEIQINDTPEPTDDYLTWAPTPARIRLNKRPVDGSAVDVVLTNQSDDATPPTHGKFAFAKTLSPGQTAAESQLAITLPSDGSWSDFFVAGQFPYASHADKDAVINVHLSSGTGPVIGKAAAMVRVRKNVEKLTDTERIAYLKAIHDLHVLQKDYEFFPMLDHASMQYFYLKSRPYSALLNSPSRALSGSKL